MLYIQADSHKIITFFSRNLAGKEGGGRYIQSAKRKKKTTLHGKAVLQKSSEVNENEDFFPKYIGNSN